MTNVPNSGSNSQVSCILERVNTMENETFRLFDKVFRKYNAENTFLSFNGGKDCTLLLHMLSRYYQSRSDFKEKTMKVLYIEAVNSFDEVDDFVQKCKALYKINLMHYKGEIQTVLQEVCDEQPELQVVFMGSRRTDPYCSNLRTMQETDEGWPELLRINPILDWNFRDVWHYILVNKVPYCTLYDFGYTSLGNKTNTKPNPHLRVVDKITGEISYRPAYELQYDDSLERAGRS